MGLFFKKFKENKLSLNLPTHLAIIMDGNGRWAKKRGMPRSVGHKFGAQTFRDIARYCSEIGIKYLTVYAFSTENWKRPQEEVNSIMNLFEDYMKEAISDFSHENMRINFIGDMSAFSESLRNLSQEIQENSKDRTGMVLNIAVNYGARAEILRTTKLLIDDILNGKISANKISEKDLNDRLYTANQPDVDLLIRTGGEYRVSNFLLWQIAYAELFVTDVLWPDFKRKDIDNAIKQFSNRNRRFGGV